MKIVRTLAAVAALGLGAAFTAPAADAAQVCRPYAYGATACYDTTTGAITFTPAVVCHPAGGGTLVDLNTGATFGPC